MFDSEMAEYAEEVKKRTMFLEVGKTYVRRDGKVITIDRLWPENDTFPFLDSANNNAYRPNGTHGGYFDRDWDIVSEAR